MCPPAIPSTSEEAGEEAGVEERREITDRYGTFRPGSIVSRKSRCQLGKCEVLPHALNGRHNTCYERSTPG